MNKKIYVVGFGPGRRGDMTENAVKAIEKSDIIVGYSTYVNLVKDIFPDKDFFETGMTGEVDRCRAAIDMAEKGMTVCVISSGDSGVYGMASLILELAEDGDTEVEVVPGVTAALSGAAVLGAPLSHDFAVISLSDLMTPMEVIKKRIRCASEADFVICIYNPSSKKRADYLREACDIMLEYKDDKTVCGIVRNIGRKDEESRTVTLRELRDIKTDMFTTVFIGNRSTKIIKNKIVTPRGYNV